MWRSREGGDTKLCSALNFGKNRRVLREATSITLALDKGKYKKVVRFRCDTPMPVADGKPAVAKGILGIVDCTHASAADHEEDHAVKAVRKLDELITTFCSPLGPGGGSCWRQTCL